MRYAVLGLLAERPSHAYELGQMFRERIGPAWQLSSGAIGQQLKRLQREGLVERTERRLTARGEAESWLYSATVRGRESLAAWRAENDESLTPVRDELLVRIALAGQEDIPQLRRALHRRELRCEEELAELRARLGNADSRQPSARTLGDWKAHAPLEYAVEQREAYVRWLARMRETVEEIAALRGGGAPDRGKP